MRLSDIVIFLISALILYGIRLYFEATLFEHLFLKYHGTRTRRKLRENLFYSLYYTCAFSYYLFGVMPSLTWRLPFLPNENVIVSQLVSPWPPEITFHEHVYYSQALGFYTAGLTFLLFGRDQKRSDYMELVVHHVVTICLVVLSYVYGYVRVGVVVLALHDVGDIFLYTAKFVHYLRYKGLDTALFACFAVSFYITRMLIYARIVYAISVETLLTVVQDPGFNQWAMYFDTYLIHYAAFVTLLGTLLILHCFWFALILRMIHRELFLGRKISDEGDIRSDDEDD